MFHEGGCVPHVLSKRVNLPGRHFGNGAEGQFAPIHFSGEICRLGKILPQRNRGEARIGLLKIETLSCNAGRRNCHYAKLASDTAIAAWGDVA
jgi:hypothetical protein